MSGFYKQTNKSNDNCNLLENCCASTLAQVHYLARAKSVFFKEQTPSKY